MIETNVKGTKMATDAWVIEVVEAIGGIKVIWVTGVIGALRVTGVIWVVAAVWVRRVTGLIGAIKGSSG